MTYIYSYRLTYFGGTAPCFDDGLLTLAICKRDMRRVIGNLYNSEKFKKENGEIWFLGIVGNRLAKIETFKKYEDKVIYAAKVKDVKEFHEYFTDTKYKERADVIYEQTQEETELKSGELYFNHTGSAVHQEKDLQKRDFDVDHPNANKYVLFSDEYCFITPEESKKIKNKIQKWPTGVGHRWFTDDNNELAGILNSLVAKGHNIKALPKEVKEIIKNKKGCGNNKGGNI